MSHNMTESEESLVQAYTEEIQQILHTVLTGVQTGRFQAKAFAVVLKHIHRLNAKAFGSPPVRQKFRFRPAQASDRQADCAICREAFGRRSVTVLQCGHQFHLKCIKSWAEWGSVCPLDRCPLN